ncbi:MAG: FliI/YscN family ATPase [Pseudomonadales bacterium]|nr:FliI/YscN family ATPase [Pseudomonadales bacterium]
MNAGERLAFLQSRLDPIEARLNAVLDSVRKPELVVQGQLTQMTGLTLVASGCRAPIGSRCSVKVASGKNIEAEVVGFTDGNLYLMPIGRVQGLKPGDAVVPLPSSPEVGVGYELLGRTIDGSGAPIDEKGDLKTKHRVNLLGPPINPYSRNLIDKPLDVGVRAINALLTLGRGQRVGLFAGTGVGKSTLLGQMTKNTEADVVVVALIGERGREVREFIEKIFEANSHAKSVVVATPADDPPLMRLHGAWRATAIAEYFRDQGKNVLLLMDSLTRFAQAQRELALAIGEPPVTKGYPPSVFYKIPQLVERAGNGSGPGAGTITAIYTVLVEGDDHNDPIADSTRGILDGHITLSRDLADSGIYPAISVGSSVSRVMQQIIGKLHADAARKFKKLFTVYDQNRDLINIGAYQPGSDALLDEAVQKYVRLQQFIQQDSSEKCTVDQSISELLDIFDH